MSKTRAKIHKYTEEQIQFLTDHIKGTSATDMHKSFNKRFELNLSLGQIKGAISRYGLKSGLDTSFKKGHQTWNKGKAFNAGGRSHETQFVKGQESITKKPIGSERIDSKDGYAYIKTTEPDVYELKHRVVYREVHGKIPEGHIVLFGDRDKTNFDIDNLILVSRKQLAVINKFGLLQDDAELNKTVLHIADLIMLTHRKEKEMKKCGKTTKKNI